MYKSEWQPVIITCVAAYDAYHFAIDTTTVMNLVLCCHTSTTVAGVAAYIWLDTVW